MNPAARLSKLLWLTTSPKRERGIPCLRFGLVEISPMKFLAILEDSFREAIASYVSMVQIALTVVFVVLLASVSFEPGDAPTALQPLGPAFVQTVLKEPDAMALLAHTPLHHQRPFAVQ